MTEISEAYRSEDPFLQAAYAEAVASYESGGIPIGAVLVHKGEIIGRGHNRRVQEDNPILHGEMTCYRNAGRLAPTVYRECVLYTTQSPCSMCTGATLLFGVPNVVIGESVSSRQVTNFLNSGLTIEDYLRSLGMTVTVHDDPGCVKLLERFMREQPEVWAEDISDIGQYSDPDFVRWT